MNIPQGVNAGDLKSQIGPQSLASVAKKILTHKSQELIN